MAGVLEEQFNGNSQIESFLSEKQCKSCSRVLLSCHGILSSYAILEYIREGEVAVT